MKLVHLAGLVVAGGAAAGLGAAGAILGTTAAVRLMAAPRIFQTHDVPEAPVAMVLGAQVFASGSPSAFLRGRLDIAHDLYAAGKVRAILVSGDNAPEHHRESSTMKQYLVERGVPPEAIVCDDFGSDTYDSCLRAKEIYDVKKLIIVTQTYHLPRAIVTARLLGLDATGAGDETACQYPKAWNPGVVREIPANIKMIIDLGRRRQPAHLGDPTDAVQTALAR
ncbi:MAG: YdcF family protein [Propionibacteriales bacterium]|nr:YdcF family protein [Propionibacteriales bacterium]